MDKRRTGLLRQFFSGTFLQLLLFAMLILFLILGTGRVSGGNRIRARRTLENSISRCITSCYALEGRYPESLEYMKARYGLTYDDDRFFVDYLVRGSNIRPDVTVIETSGGDRK